VAKGKEYELLARQVFNHIVNRGRAETIDVQHDVRLRGKSGLLHQIDVHWEIEVGGYKHRVVVEARDRSRRADKDNVLAFAGKVDDLPRGTIGIMVSRKGFQSGAQTLATERRIVLLELREPRPDDWDGHIKSVEVKMELLGPVVHKASLAPDIEWGRAELKKLGIPKGETIQFQLDLPLDDPGGPMLFNADGSCHARLLPILHRLNLFNEATGRTCRTVQMSDDLFAETGHPRLPRIRIAAMELDYEVMLYQSTILVDAGHFVDVVLRSIGEGKTKFFSTNALTP